MAASLRLIALLSMLATSVRAQGPEEAEPAPAEPPAEEAAPAEPAPSDPALAEARERLARGESLFAEGDHDGALAEFERAYEIVGEHPVRFMILYNIARAHEREFRYDLALRYYRRYLEEGGPDAPRREAVTASLETLEELRAPGYETVRREIQIAARSEETIFVELTPLAQQYRGFDPVIFASVLAGAAASAIAGGAVGIYAVVRSDELRRPTVTLTREERQEQVRRLTITADVLLFGVTGLLLGTAIALAFLTDWGGEPEEHASVRPWIVASPEAAALGVQAAW
jgi:tetratricopeptide (TPR) repeat protein